MRHDARICVLVPAHDEERNIGRVIETMPHWVDHVIVVDDASRDATAERVLEAAAGQPEGRIVLVRHEQNRGVGGAISSGYLKAIELGADVTAIMDGDGQMPPEDLASIVDPVAKGECDFAKANRLVDGEAWRIIPKRRYFGNAALTFLTKIASGYYSVTDSQTGFTAISGKVLRRIDVATLWPRYGYPNDMLVRLNVARARVKDVPSKPVYDVGEQSKLKIHRVLLPISWLLFKRFWWRMLTLYVVRDFHPLVLFFALGVSLWTTGLALGTWIVVELLNGHHPTGATAVLVSLAIQSGLLLLLFAMLFDFEHNQPLNPGD
jgi:glycosyltransferase involved in cell wall biosynthesis